jgi:hypothetical protein
MKAALLADRSVIRVAGDDARRFLHGLLTADIANLSPESPRYAALLTPQGKIVADFIVTAAKDADGPGFLLDCPRAVAPTLLQRLNFYKLRSRVTVEDLSDRLGVLALWDGGNAAHARAYRDPRLPALGWRLIMPPQSVAAAVAELKAKPVDPADYEAHRVALGIPSGGADFAYGDAFPHEADMDQLGGVDFDKGCYVGQEVVSRVEHRATARSRVVPVAFEGGVPASGAAVTAGEKQIGRIGSVAAGRGLAMLRLDRVADAMAATQPLRAGGVGIRPVRPDWAKFAFPGEDRGTA